MLRRPGVRAALGYAAVVLALLGPSLRPGRTLVPADALTQYHPYREAAGGFRAHNPLVSDAATQFFPWMRFLGASLREGRVPEWNPLLAGGVPVSPNGYVAPWYPGFWLAGVLDPADAYGAFVALHLVIGALGVYVLARALGARPLAAFLAGLLAPASGFWLHWSLHLVHLAGVVWAPWALAAALRVLERPEPGRAGALAAVLGLWWLGANPQFALFGGIVLALWCVVGLARGGAAGLGGRRATAAAWLGAGALCGALLAAPTLLPEVAPTVRIVREREPAAATVRTHLPLRHAVRALVPDATGNPTDGFLYAATAEQAMDSPYVGTVAVVLVAASAVGAARAGPARWALALTALVVLLTFTGPPHHVLRWVVPGYDRVRGAARWTSMLAPLALPLAALGLDALRSGERRAARAARVAALVGAVVVCAWLLRELAVPTAPHGYLARRAALAIALLAAVGLAAHRPRLAAGVVAACVTVELVVAVPRWFPRVRERDAYPPVAALTEAARRGGRLARTGPGGFPTAVPPDVPMVYGVADTSALTPVFPADWDRLLRLVADHGDTVRTLNVAPALPPRALGSPLLAVLDVRTVVGPRGTVVARRAGRAATVVARAVPATRRAARAALARTDRDPVATAAVEGLDRIVVGGPARVRALPVDRPDCERWRVVSARGGFLRVSGRWDRGWRARIDGRPVRVFRADGVFRGVVVPPGVHTVTFEYSNPVERRGRALGVAGLVALAALAVAGRATRVMARRNGTGAPLSTT